MRIFVPPQWHSGVLTFGHAARLCAQKFLVVICPHLHWVMGGREHAGIFIGESEGFLSKVDTPIAPKKTSKI